MTGTLHHGDCLDVLRSMPDGCVSHVVTDPPYGQTNESYDSPVAFTAELWRECFRVCKPDAALISFAGSPTYHRIASAIEAGGWKVRQMWGWVYRDGMIASAYPKEGFDRLAPAMDPICFATKSKVLLSLEREGNPWSIGTARSKASPMSDRFRSPETMSAPGRYPKTIVSDGCTPFEYFAGSRTASRNGDRTEHPNQKPLPVMRWLVSKLPPGGVILDPFAGSGTTLVAAEAEGFDSVGIERDSVYIGIARVRLGESEQETRMPLFDVRPARRLPQPSLFDAEVCDGGGP